MDALAIESKNLRMVPDFVVPILGHEEGRVADLAHGFALDRTPVIAETARVQNLRSILRI